MNTISCTAFEGEHRLASGPPWVVGLAVRDAIEAGRPRAIVIFDDWTGRQIDFDLRGSREEIEARLGKPVEAPEDGTRTKRGRPKLGVVSREVTLLPRHWDWLSEYSGGASAKLRRLVERARKEKSAQDTAPRARQAADRFMMSMLGDQPNYEDVSRALYSGDRRRFLTLSESWPAELRDHAWRLAAPAFETPPEVNAVRDLLQSQFQISWALLAYHLEDLGSDECLWRPSPSSPHVEPNEQGKWVAQWPESESYALGQASIAWTTWHICYWWTKAIGHLSGNVRIERDDVEWPGPVDVRRTLEELRHDWLRLLADWSERELHLPVTDSWPLPDASPSTIAAWLNLELMKNAAEIGAVRFLFGSTAEHEARTDDDEK